VNVVVSLVIFISHVFMGGELTTRDVFTIMSLTNVMQLELTKHLSLGIMAASECYVSVRRIQKFLEVQELSHDSCKNVSSVDDKKIEHEDVVISLRDVSCYWDSSTMDQNAASSEDAYETQNYVGVLAVKDVNIEFKRNQLTCIIGSVGSGKSALLLALAGELEVSKGNIHRSTSSLAYASQDPWIMNGSVKENILMGLSYDKEHYHDIVKSCGLDVDFQQFQDGDDTVVGDRGVQCSGGQRARIGLARALYRNADILLLDDPLSAVDSRVGNLIFYEAIKNIALKRGCCVILVTHQHQFIGDSRCLLVSDGMVQTDGTFSDCVAAANGALHFVTQKSLDEDESRKESSIREKDSGEKNMLPATENNMSKQIFGKLKQKSSEQDEIKETGVVSKATFLHYMQCMGGPWVALYLLLLCTITQALALGSIAMIGRWSERPVEQQRSWDILGVVLGLGVGVVLFAFIRSIAFFRLAIRASKRLHNAMSDAVMRAKIEFFDTNPSGRILNRFSADVGSNDDLLPHTLFDFFMCAFIVAGSLITAIASLPYILIVMPFLVWYFYTTRSIFVTTSRELKRLEGLARSPIFAMLSESISGVATIRSNDAVKYIRNKFENFHDAHTRSFFSFLASSRWVGFRMDSLMFITVSVSSLLAVVFSDQGWFEVDPVIFGLALSMLIQLGSIFQWTIRQSAEVVNQMVCVERVSEYSKLESEAPLITDFDKDLVWPQSGNIQVNDLSVRYRSTLPLSLRGVSFNIQSGQRIGVVGRTGSGKSTLVQTLFRILETESGCIKVDGIDISKLGLHKLRKGMSVINQYPVLFSGCTIRENLDPFEQYSDEAIKEALTDVQMINAVDDLPEGMHSLVAESGSNFSVGERQLLCLARATLQRSQILVLDEPTANVDSRTDKLLQEAVNKSFTSATIVSVAHRLDTIIDNDLILVLGSGSVIEYGSPRELIEKKGCFFEMVMETGAAMSQELCRRAYNNK